MGRWLFLGGLLALLCLVGCRRKSDEKGSILVRKPVLMVVRYPSEASSGTAPQHALFLLSVKNIQHMTDIYQGAVSRYEESLKNWEANGRSGGKPALPQIQSQVIWNDGLNALNARIIRKTGKTTYFHFNFSDCGVATVIDEFPYSGEDFKLVTRGADWYAAMTMYEITHPKEEAQ